MSAFLTLSRGPTPATCAFAADAARHWLPPRSAEATLPSPVLLEKTVYVLVGVERNEIVDRLADADVADRQLQIVGDRHRDAALRPAVRLGQDRPLHAGHGHEFARLHQAVLPDRRIEHEQHFLRRAFYFARGDAPNLVELVHEVDARVQPARGVHENRIAPFRLSP